ncbi:MAG: hypothetical protein IPG60_04615 [Bacteroidetes bacterium]|nr:hypothetical protein [Bacteroidota bacterium]MBK7108992.1 hypothetical protein [Bacteroidota bacterium]
MFFCEGLVRTITSGKQKDFSASGYDEIQRENLSSGMYFYSIINQTGLEVANGKIIWE